MPGWEAIDRCLEFFYPGQEHPYLRTLLHARIGGTDYLDGASVYYSSKGYRHAVTYDMSEVFVNEEALSEDLSGWGFEMTVKLFPTEQPQDRMAATLLGNLTGAANTEFRLFEPLQYTGRSGQSINWDILNSSLRRF